jgi:hypothetical protein
MPVREMSEVTTTKKKMDWKMQCSINETKCRTILGLPRFGSRGQTWICESVHQEIRRLRFLLPQFCIFPSSASSEWAWTHKNEGYWNHRIRLWTHDEDTIALSEGLWNLWVKYTVALILRKLHLEENVERQEG